MPSFCALYPHTHDWDCPVRYGGDCFLIVPCSWCGNLENHKADCQYYAQLRLHTGGDKYMVRDFVMNVNNA